MSFGRNLANKYGRKLLDTATKTGLGALNNTTKKVAHKAAKATKVLRGNKVANKIIKSKPVPDENLRNVAETLIPQEQRKEIFNALRRVL